MHELTFGHFYYEKLGTLLKLLNLLTFDVSGLWKDFASIYHVEVSYAC